MVNVDAGFAGYLRRLREDQGWSLRRLGAAVHCSHGHLWDLEHGRKQPSIAVAVLLDDALEAGGQLAGMVRTGLDDGVPAVPDGADDAAELWTLIPHLSSGGVFDARRFLLPALRWLTTPPAAATAGTGGRPVGMPDVELLRQMLAVVRSIDNRYGGGHVADRLTSMLRHDVAELVRGRYDARTGAALLSVAAEATQMAGWASYDVGRHALAQRYMMHALRLAGAAHDRPLGAEILAAMSHQAAYLGAGSEAVDLARAAARAGDEAGVGAITAEAAVLEAQGHAVTGAAAASASALDRAERLFDRAERGSDPQWLRYFDEGYLAARFGQTLAALGRGDLALRFAERSLDMDGVQYARGKAFNLSLVARAHAQAGDVEAAASAAHVAADAVEGIDSARARDYLAEVADRLAPHAGLEPVATYRARVAELG